MTCSHTFPLAPMAESQMSSYWTLLLNNALTLDGLCAHCSTLCPLSLLPNPWNTHSKSTLETRAFPHLQYKVLASFSPLYLSLSHFLQLSLPSVIYFISMYSSSSSSSSSTSSTSSSPSSSSPLCSTTALPSWPQLSRQPVWSTAQKTQLPPSLLSVTRLQHLEERQEPCSVFQSCVVSDYELWCGICCTQLDLRTHKTLIIVYDTNS